MPLDNQALEGLASVVQIMCNRAPSSHHSSISDRLSIKIGDPITADTCEAIDQAVVEHMTTIEHHNRFLPVPAVRRNSLESSTCPHAKNMSCRLYAPFAYGAFESLHKGAKHAWSVESKDKLET